MKRISILLITCFMILSFTQISFAQEKKILVHMKTDLGKDDAQICVAYNIIWASIENGYKVNVLIDASAVNTYKKGWFGKDKLEGYKMPESLRIELSKQFNVDLINIPKTYGDYLKLLHEKGAKFYINGAMLVVSGISDKFGDTSKLSTDLFVPIDLKKMVDLVKEADKYIAY